MEVAILSQTSHRSYQEELALLGIRDYYVAILSQTSHRSYRWLASLMKSKGSQG